jgi:hypothetical protein
MMRESALFHAGENVERSGFGRPGFAEQYHAVRPRLPAALVDLLTQYVGFLPELRAAGVGDEEIGLDEFRRVASLRMGSSGRWFTGYGIRLGIRRER